MVTAITTTTVQQELKNILQKKINIVPFNNPVVSLEEDYFFGENIGLDARKMVYLVYFVEDYFSIRFTPKEMDDPAFYRLSGMANMIARKFV